MVEQITQWLEQVKEAVEANTKKQWPTCEANWSTIYFRKGKKYIKVFTAPIGSENGSCFMFIDMEGNIYKPASWKAPAKGVRAHISTTDASKLDGSTGWLYR